MKRRYQNIVLRNKTILSVIFCVFIGGVMMTYAPFVLASPPFEDNFNSYIADATLAGQGNWVGTSATILVRDDAECLEEKCIEQTGAESNVYRLGESTTDGTIYVYFRLASRGAGGNTWLYFRDYEYTGSIAEFSKLGDDIKMASGWGLDTLLTGTATSTWYALICEYKNLDDPVWDNKQIRCKIDNNAFTEWRKIVGSPLTNFGLIIPTLPTILDRLDLISGACNSEHCAGCETYESCIAKSCEWYYSIYLQQYFCSAYTPAPEECGAFFKCQYCLAQETCEAELNCEWINKFGTGEACFMKEPTIPPVQAGWEVPELEDCEALSGVEKWLCEIKNFIAGIFMPSQGKIDDLYATIGNFKQKFPFNYVGLFSDFFGNIKESLSEEKEIPVKILGATSSVDLSFWNSSTTIGGIGENFKNIIKDFSSVGMLLGFLVWAIHFIKRFWV